MTTFFTILSIIAMGAVLVVLVRGLMNMVRAGDSNLSQRLMRMRVMLQFVAVALVMVVLIVSN